MKKKPKLLIYVLGFVAIIIAIVQSWVGPIYSGKEFSRESIRNFLILIAIGVFSILLLYILVNGY